MTLAVGNQIRTIIPITDEMLYSSDPTTRSGDVCIPACTVGTIRAINMDNFTLRFSVTFPVAYDGQFDWWLHETWFDLVLPEPPHIRDHAGISAVIARRRDDAKDIRDRDAYQAMLDNFANDPSIDVIDAAMRAFSMWVYLRGQLELAQGRADLQQSLNSMLRTENAALERQKQTTRAQLCMAFCDGYNDDTLAFFVSLEETIKTERKRAVQEYVQDLDRRAAGG